MTHGWAFWIQHHLQFSTTNGFKGYSPSQLLFGRDMIILVKHMVDQELIRQKNQMQINKYIICENRN